MWGIFGNINRIPMMKTHKILFSFFLILMSGLGFSQSVPSYVPTNGLVGWWGFNGNAQDGSGNGNHGTVNGATSTADRFGNQNGAYQFANSEISIADNSLLDSTFSNSFSLAFWYKSFFSSSNNFDGLVCRGFQYANPPIFGVQVGLTPSGLGLQTNPSNCNYHFSQVDTNVWKHILLSFQFDSSGNGSISYYSNGLFEQVYSCFRPLALGNNNFPLKFGVEREGTEFFKGKLDDIGIWNRALTPQEITNLYNSQLPTQTSLCLPTITTSAPSSVGVDTVVIGGDISNDGGSSIVLRGICYSTSPNPNMGNQRTEDGSGTGSFNTVLRGLNPSTTYYARSYAKNSNGVVVYGNEVSFTTSASLPGVRCPGSPTVTDIDGNIYNIVQIGTQCWTQSNLKVSKYRNGDSIPTGLSNSQWSSTSSGAYAIYNNDPFNDGLYGKLYNHYAVADSRGLCPTGWHLPSDGEWNVLVKYLDPNADTTCHNCFQNIAGGMMKNTGTQLSLGGWFSPNVGATNQSGFTGLPGGGGGGNSYGGLGGLAIWWSTTYAWGNFYRCRTIFNDYAGVNRTIGVPTDGFSVRCLKNTLPQVNTTSVTNVTPSSALVTGEVISEGGDQNTTRGFCYSTASNPTLSNDTTMNGTGTGVYSNTLQNLTPSTTYYVRAYATNSVGTSYGSELSFTTQLPAPQPCPGIPTVTDIDGNIYNTVQIGNQCWTQSNLKVSKYRNGDSITYVTDNLLWSQNVGFGSCCHYDNHLYFDTIGVGRLYNGYAVLDIRGLCPTGWHIPVDADWTTLENAVGGSSVAGIALKSSSTNIGLGGWPPNPLVINSNTSGFTALSAGFRDVFGGFVDFGRGGGWWSASRIDSLSLWSRRPDCCSNNWLRMPGNQIGGFSVRCLKNTIPQVNTTSVTNVTPSSAFVTGEVISEGGDQNIVRGFCYSTTSNPTISNDTTMNGTGTGVYSKTLQNLTPLTTYYVRAYATNSLGTSYGNEVTFTTDSIRIGSNYAGGIVFYVDSTGQHGLVCAPSDQGVAEWGCYGVNIPGTLTSFGTGQINTNLVISGCSSRPIAASLCSDLTIGNYSDWFLPSLDELVLMQANLHQNGIGNFLNNWYWSSSQGGVTYPAPLVIFYNAWTVNFTDGTANLDGHFTKMAVLNVRAIRSF